MRTKLFSALPFMLILASSGYAQTTTTIEEKPFKFKGKILIGVEAPLSGDQQSLGEGMLYGAQLAAEHINAAGGLKRKEIVIMPIDDAADPEIGKKAAKKAKGLKGVIGPYNSGVGIETLPIYLKRGLLPIRLTSNNDTDGMGYTLQPMSDEIAPMAAQALTTWLGAESVGIIFDSTQKYTTGIAADLEANLLSAGVTITSSTGILPGADSYAAEVEALAALNPDVIYVATYFPEGGLIAKAMHDQDVSAKCLVDYGAADPGFVTAAGIDAAMKCNLVGVPSPTEFPLGPQFAAEYKSRFGIEPGTWSPYTYDSVNFLIDGVKATPKQKFGKKKLKPVLDNVTDWQGVTGSVTINPLTGNREPATLVVLSVDADGQLVINKDWAEAVGAPY